MLSIHFLTTIPQNIKHLCKKLAYGTREMTKPGGPKADAMRSRTLQTPIAPTDGRHKPRFAFGNEIRVWQIITRITDQREKKKKKKLRAQSIRHVASVR